MMRQFTHYQRLLRTLLKISNHVSFLDHCTAWETASDDAIIRRLDFISIANLLTKWTVNKARKSNSGSTRPNATLGNTISTSSWSLSSQSWIVLTKQNARTASSHQTGTRSCSATFTKSRCPSSFLCRHFSFNLIDSIRKVKFSTELQLSHTSCSPLTLKGIASGGNF